MPALAQPESPQQSKTQIIEEIVDRLKYFCQLYSIDSIFLVGGYTRSLYLGDMESINDIDVASAYSNQSQLLAGIFASEVLDATPTFYERTGTAAVEYKEMRIEFQNYSSNAYMYNQDVRDWMRFNGIEDVPLMHNIYGRDFTINSLIYSLNSGKLLDPTDRAEKDFDDGRIVSLLPAHLLIKNNPLAILRAIRFALIYDFKIDEGLSIAMKEGKDKLSKSLSKDRIMKEIVKILKIDSVEGLKLLKKYGVEYFLMSPEVGEFVEIGGK